MNAAASTGASGAQPEEAYPGQWLGLPAQGRGSLASWRSRVAAIIIDWAACMGVAVLIFGTPVITGSDWRAWMILALFVLETTIFVTVASGSFGQLITRIAVVRLDRRPVGFPRALLRAVLISFALPAVVIGAHRRGLQDMAANTVVVNRR